MTPELLGDPPLPPAAAFRARFGGEPAVMASAPGRVELLGNHTDYNGGLVIAAAIDRKTVFVGRQIPGREARVASVHFDELDTFSLDAIEPSEPGSWTRYVRGVCWALTEWCGSLSSGFEVVFAGNVPLGAGLSSSASLQAACATFLIELGVVPGRSSSELSAAAGDALRMELAQVLRRSENEFVGVGSGLLDQFSSLFGARDALFSLIAAPTISTACRWVAPGRRSSCATRAPRAGSPTGCTTRDAPNAIGSWLLSRMTLPTAKIGCSRA